MKRKERKEEGKEKEGRGNILSRILHLKTRTHAITRKRRISPGGINSINLLQTAGTPLSSLQFQPRNRTLADTTLSDNRALGSQRARVLGTWSEAERCGGRVEIEGRGRGIGEIMMPGHDEGGDRVHGIRGLVEG